jgi:ribosomal protein L22
VATRRASAPAPERQIVRAEAKYVRSSARKARLVTDLIRGRSVPEARTVLAFSERAVARDVERVLRSAIANAEANHQLLGDELLVLEAYADEGPTLKRWRARARGRVARIRKRTCHITVKLAEPPESAQPRRPVRTQAQPEQAPAADEKPKRAPRVRKPKTETKAEKPAAEKRSKPRASSPKSPKASSDTETKPKRKKKTEES